MDKDKGHRKEPLLEDEEGVVEVTPPGEGAGRSRRVRELPPSPQGQEGEGESGGGRAIRDMGQEEVGDPMKEVSHALDDLEVNPKVKVGTANGGDVIGKRSLGHQQQLVVEMGMDPPKMGGSLVQLPEEPSPSPAMNSNSPTRSFEDQEGEGEESSENYAGEEELAHPCLFIENVLDVIVKHIIEQPGTRQAVVKDVRSIRQVCRTWKDSVTLAYRGSAPTITFAEYDDPFPYPPGVKVLKKFMDAMKFSQMIPVQKFRFDSGVFRRQCGNPKLFEDFLRLCGPEVVSLAIHIDSRDWEKERLALDLYSSDWSMPKLKTLKLSMYHYTPCQARFISNSERRTIVNLMECLLTAAKTLGMLGLYFRSICSCSHPSHPDNIITRQLGQVLARRIPTTVKELDLAMEIDETTFNNLAESGLELDTFKFTVDFDLACTTLYQFLQSQSASINVLRIIWNSCRDERGVYVQFPPLLQLVQLQFNDVIISTTAPWDFANTFPKLNRLDLSHMLSKPSLEAVLSCVRKPSQSLKVLHLPELSDDSLAPLIKTVAQSFPCLEELHIELWNNFKETMEEVIKYFDNLVSLNMTFSNEIRTANGMDSLFSGIPESDCIRMARLQDFENENMDEIHRRPSLLNLTKMRKLAVQLYDPEHFPLTDISAHFVFLEMPNLSEIHLKSQTQAVQFSPRYLELLKDKLVIHGVEYGE